MKRILIRLSAISLVAVLGLTAIVQAQRNGSPLRTVAEPARPVFTDTIRPIGQARAAVDNPLRATTGFPPASSTIVPVSDETSGPVAGGVSPIDIFSLQTAAANLDDQGGQPPTAGQPLLGAPTLAPSRDFAQPAAAPAIPPNTPTMAPVGYPPLDARAQPLGTNAPDTRALGTGAPSLLPYEAATTRAGPIGSAPGIAPSSPMANGSGQPGNKTLEGPQTPQLVIEKFAPEEIQVGRPAVFRIRVRNTGPTTALDVEIHDEVPQGTRLKSTTPQAARGTQGGLVWDVGTIGPDEEYAIEMELMPIDEGEIGSVATVHFRAEASARTFATRPQLAVEANMPEKVLKGEEVTLTITVSNPGTGLAEGIVLEEHVPPGFQHPAGSQLQYEVGDLAPGTSREIQLTLLATHAGQTTNVLSVEGEPSLRTESQQQIEVIAPKLDVAVAGPKRRYLEREAVYTLSVSNPGTASARQVELIAHLPPGLKFVDANHNAHYEEDSCTVRWLLDELPVQETAPVQLTAMPVEAGEHTLRFRSNDDSGATGEVEQAVHIEGIAAIFFEVVDVDDPIEVGGETTYEIRIVNQGSKTATNVQLAVLLPPEMRMVAAEGPARHAVDSGRVLFEPLARLAPKVDTTYRVRVQGLSAGDQRVRVQVITDELQTPVTKEESTRVYADE